MPLVVAVNKIDKPEADPDRVKTELARYNVMSEDWGGDCQFVRLAKSGQNIDDLLERPSDPGRSVGLKAVVDGKGQWRRDRVLSRTGAWPVATVLVQGRHPRQGDIAVRSGIRPCARHA